MYGTFKEEHQLFDLNLITAIYLSTSFVFDVTCHFSLNHCQPSSHLATVMENPAKILEGEHAIARGNSKRFTQIFAAFVAHLGAFSYGCVWSWSCTALPSLKEVGSLGCLAEHTESWISSIVYIGALVSSPLTSYLMVKVGRRTSLLLLNPGIAAGWIIIAFAQTVPMLYVGRFLTGMCAGGMVILIPIFISEVAAPDIRGILVCALDPSLAAGMLYIYIIGSYTTWSTQALCCIAVPSLATLLLIFLPESPRFLLMNAKVAQAKASLTWYRLGNAESEITEEFDEMGTSVGQIIKTECTKYSWRNLTQMSVVRPTLIGMSLISFHMASGNYAILANTVDIFKSAGVEHAYLFTVVVGIANMIGSLATLILVERCGRRVLLLVSEAIVSLTLIGLGFYFHFKAKFGSEFAELHFSWFPLAMFVIYEIAFSIGIGPIPYVLIGEILPLSAKGISSAVISITESIVGFIVLYTFLDMMEYFGEAVGYWGLATICLLGMAVIYFIVPETKGRTLEQIQFSFQTEDNSQPIKSSV